MDISYNEPGSDWEVDNPKQYSMDQDLKQLFFKTLQIGKVLILV